MSGTKGWFISLTVAVLGVVIAAVILLRDVDSAPREAFNPPTPAPLITTSVPTRTPIPLLGTVLPQIDLLTVDGEPLVLRDAEGKSLILNFWATWCVPCQTEMPTLSQFAAQNSDSVEVLAVTDPENGQSQEAIRDFLAQYGFADLTVALDESGALTEHFLVEALPMTYIIDSAGVVRFRHVGEVTELDLADYLARLETDTHEHRPE